MTPPLAALTAVAPAPSPASPALPGGAASAAGQPPGPDGAFSRELERVSASTQVAEGPNPRDTHGPRRGAARAAAHPRAERTARRADIAHLDATPDRPEAASRQREPGRRPADQAGDVAEGAASLTTPGASIGATPAGAGDAMDIGQWMAQLIDGAQGPAAAGSAAQAAADAAASGAGVGAAASGAGVAAAAAALAGGTPVRGAPAERATDVLAGPPVAGAAADLMGSAGPAGPAPAAPATGGADSRSVDPWADKSPPPAPAGMMPADGPAAQTGGPARVMVHAANPQAATAAAESPLAAWRSALREALLPVERTPLRPADGAGPAALAPGQVVALPMPATALPSAAAPADPVVESPVAAAPGTPEFAAAVGTQVVRFVREGVEHARLQLHPADLGPVAVQLAVDGTQVRVDLVAEMAVTRAALEQGLPALAGALREAGFTLSGGGVFQQAPDGGNGEPGRESATASRRAIAAGSVSPADGGPAAPARQRRPTGLVDTFA